MTTPVHDFDDPRRAAIVRQARLHFISEGYAGTRMEPIARESGVSTATLYAFFDSKAVLFEAVIDNASEDFARFLTRAPGCFVFIGNGMDSPSLHNPQYDFNDACLPRAVEFFAELTRRRLPAA